MAALLGASMATPAFTDIPAEACGSPGESENRPELGDRYYLDKRASIFDRNQIDTPHDIKQGKQRLWYTLALNATDQLRQRMAWSLNQIFPIGEEAVSCQQCMDRYLGYYDIFVRHAFGNYRDVMREVSYSPVMGTYLTFMYNKALDFGGTYPDENYARELMQLFTIGG
jgi:cullin-associated NEDD8-dissociated protein 1